VQNLDWAIIAQRFAKEAEKISCATDARSELSERLSISDLVESGVGRNENSYATSLNGHADYETR